MLIKLTDPVKSSTARVRVFGYLRGLKYTLQEAKQFIDGGLIGIDESLSLDDTKLFLSNVLLEPNSKIINETGQILDQAFFEELNDSLLPMCTRFSVGWSISLTPQDTEE